MTALAHAVKAAGWRLATFAWSGLAAISIYLAIVSLGPTLERNFNPVLQNVRAEVLKVEYHTVYFRVTVDKIRPCQIISIRWYAGEPYKWYETALLDLSGSEYTRPPGQFTAAVWKVTFPDGYETSPHFASFIHKCHGLWQTETTIPFKSWLAEARR